MYMYWWCLSICSSVCQHFIYVPNSNFVPMHTLIRPFTQGWVCMVTFDYPVLTFNLGCPIIWSYCQHSCLFVPLTKWQETFYRNNVDFDWIIKKAPVTMSVKVLERKQEKDSPHSYIWLYTSVVLKSITYLWHLEQW